MFLLYKNPLPHLKAQIINTDLIVSVDHSNLNNDECLIINFCMGPQVVLRGELIGQFLKDINQLLPGPMKAKPKQEGEI